MFNRYEQENIPLSDFALQTKAEKEKQTAVIRVFPSGNEYRPHLLSSFTNAGKKGLLNDYNGDLGNLTIEYKGNTYVMPEEFVKRLERYQSTSLLPGKSLKNQIDCHPFAAYMCTGNADYLDPKKYINDYEEENKVELLYRGTFADISPQKIADIMTEKKLKNGDRIILSNDYDAYPLGDKYAEQTLSSIKFEDLPIYHPYDTWKKNVDSAVNKELESVKENIERSRQGRLDSYIWYSVMDNLYKQKVIGNSGMRDGRYEQAKESEKENLLQFGMLNKSDIAVVDNFINQYYAKSPYKSQTANVRLKNYIENVIEGSRTKLSAIRQKIYDFAFHEITKDAEREALRKFGLGPAEEHRNQVHSMVYLGVQDLVISKFGRTPVEISSLYGVINFYRSAAEEMNKEDARKRFKEGRIKLEVLRANY